MELVVDVTETDGRLQGTVRRPASTVTHPFSGTLELLACLERLGCGEDTARTRATGETS
ncbi:hypothetical protein [Pseudonocardia endophytica]|uniref:Uncharacterized protein n=1 Tax=Pseudonocardia endophytica TaxID=401976 RepID=A0A4R1I0Z4_PSEEN|nr:hypothetical protein [Pseudonocardia endophytica]TCK27563.1 hypothetical protein EV378_3435 [Pseudonocardia endophytica]